MNKTYFDYDYSGSEGGSDTVAAASSPVVWIIGIIAIVILAAILICVIISLTKISKMNERINSISIKVGNMEGTSNDSAVGVVFCKKCGSQFKAIENVCPYCGTKK